ncbi:MAG: hypothetical protein D6689_02015 [Deltaproteobacteria bacterium]|nr:MAG: hypothetical protein D6689_02015 [Deltaproteobacteria bacterium]
MRVVVCCAIAVATAACGTDSAACIEVDSSCQPLYEPVFDQVYARTLAPKCGLPGGSCHGDPGRRAGLAFVDEQEAYDLLLDGRVVPGDAACSELARRVLSTDPAIKMPPGANLAPGEACAIVQWIAAGAER